MLCICVVMANIGGPCGVCTLEWCLCGRVRLVHVGGGMVVKGMLVQKGSEILGNAMLAYYLRLRCFHGSYIKMLHEKVSFDQSVAQK